jgi:hypothetical protein
MPDRRRVPRRTGEATVALLAAALGVALLGGCSSAPDEGAADPPPGMVAPENRSGDRAATRLDPMSNPQQVPVLARAHLGEVVSVRRVTLYDSGFSLEVRDPDKPENLDTYRYDGERWASQPVSVSMREIEELPKTTFALGAVKWSALPGLADRALNGLDLEGENVTAISIDRIPGAKPRVYIGVNGLRGSGRLIADADGTNVEITRN